MSQKQIQIQHQKVKQHVNDIWNRVLFSLELMEYATNEVSSFPDSFVLDNIFADLQNEEMVNNALEGFKDKDNLEDKDIYIQLQIRAFARGIKNKEVDVTNDMLWLMKDFFSWISGRRDKKWSRIDDYSLPIIKCLMGLEYKSMVDSMPDDIEPDDSNEEEDFNLLDVVSALGTSAHLVDGVERKVEENNNKASEDHHNRGEELYGILRIYNGWITGKCKNADDKDSEWFFSNVISQYENIE